MLSQYQQGFAMAQAYAAEQAKVKTKNPKAGTNQKSTKSTSISSTKRKTNETSNSKTRLSNSKHGTDILLVHGKQQQEEEEKEELTSAEDTWSMTRSSLGGGSSGRRLVSSPPQSPKKKTVDKTSELLWTGTPSTASSALDLLRDQVQTQERQDLVQQIERLVVPRLQEEQTRLQQQSRELQAALQVHSARATARFQTQNPQGTLLSLRRLAKTRSEYEAVQTAHTYLTQQIESICQLTSVQSKSSSSSNNLASLHQWLETGVTDCLNHVQTILQQQQQQQQQQAASKHLVVDGVAIFSPFSGRNNNNKDDDDELLLQEFSKFLASSSETTNH